MPSLHLKLGTGSNRYRHCLALQCHPDDRGCDIIEWDCTSQHPNVRADQLGQENSVWDDCPSGFTEYTYDCSYFSCANVSCYSTESAAADLAGSAGSHPSSGQLIASAIRRKASLPQGIYWTGLQAYTCVKGNVNVGAQLPARY